MASWNRLTCQVEKMRLPANKRTFSETTLTLKLNYYYTSSSSTNYSTLYVGGGRQMVWIAKYTQCSRQESSEPGAKTKEDKSKNLPHNHTHSFAHSFTHSLTHSFTTKLWAKFSLLTLNMPLIRLTGSINRSINRSTLYFIQLTPNDHLEGKVT